MAQDFFSGYPCRLVHAGGNLDLIQLRGTDFRPGSQYTEVIAAGDVDRKAVVLSHADPGIQITSADLATIIGVISPSAGLKLTATSTFRLQKRDSGGTFDTGANHMNVTVPAGFVAIDTISARQDDNQQGAFAQLMLWPHSADGITEPLVEVIGQAIAAPAPAFGSQFFLGPAYLGASELEGLLASEVRFGIDYKLKRASGDVFARKGAIARRRPIIRLTFDRLTNLNTSHWFNAAITTDDLKVYFWKGVHGGDRVAVGSGVHVKATVDEGSWAADNLSWQDDEDGNLVLEIKPTLAMALSDTSTIP